MIKSILKISIRYLVKQKTYAFINIFGLAVGLACAFFIVLWVQDEMSVDGYHENSDRVYAVMRHSTFGGNKGTTRSMPKQQR